MNIRLRGIALTLLAALAARPARAGSAGAESLDFLLLDANARSVALGGAYAALAQDANALLYNPAGLARVHRSEATMMHNQYFQDITQEYMAVAFRQGWGLNLNYLNFGQVPQTTVSSPLGTGSSVGLTDLALGAGYAQSFGSQWSLGTGLKYVQESLAGYSASGFAFDLGALWTPVDRWAVGFALQNLGSDVEFQSVHEGLPLLERLGAAYRFRLHGWPGVLSADVLKEKNESFKLAVGAEWMLVDRLAFRLGWSQRNDAGPGIATGLGWTQGDWSVDYAFVPYGDLGTGSRLSATLRFGKGGEKPVEPAPQRSHVEPSTAPAPAPQAPSSPAPVPVPAQPAPAPQTPTSPAPAPAPEQPAPAPSPQAPTAPAPAPTPAPPG